MEQKKYLKWYNKIGYGSGDIAGNVVYGLWALLCSFGLEVVVHLTYDCLEVALEETVTEGDEEECETCEREKPADVS